MVYYHLAVIYMSEKRYEEAIHVLERLIEFDQENTAAYFHLGTAYLKKTRIPEAIKTFKHILRLNPDNKQARDMLSFILDVDDP